MKNINNFDGKYMVDDSGNVFSRKGRALKCSINSVGYKQLFTYLNGKFFKAYLVHRLIWETYNGEIPEGFEIDHINRNKLDNRLENLRLLTHKENLWNKESKGYCWIATYKKWKATITANGVVKHLGYFKTEDKAHEAYIIAKQKYHIISSETAV